MRPLQRIRRFPAMLGAAHGRLTRAQTQRIEHGRPGRGQTAMHDYEPAAVHKIMDGNWLR